MPIHSASTYEAHEDRVMEIGLRPTFRKPEQYCIMRLKKDGESSKYIAEVLFGCKFMSILEEDMPEAQTPLYLDLKRVEPSDIDAELERCHCHLNHWINYNDLFSYYANTCVKIMEEIDNGNRDQEALVILRRYLTSPNAATKECAKHLQDQYERNRPDSGVREGKQQAKVSSSSRTEPGPLVRCVLNM
ncbi:MAG: hypothetical protein Q9183_004555 [Haloplaca sp. 2 TL-2023]